MALKYHNPTTPGRRGLVSVDRSLLHRGGPVKALTHGLTEKAGRNNRGRITARRRGGGHKRLYREIDFVRKREGRAVVERIEYDPNRTAFIALIRYENGTLNYILAPQRLAAGDTVQSGAGAEIEPGHAMSLSSIPVGTLVHNVEMKPGKGGQLARSAGSYVQIVGRDQGYVMLKLMSSEVRMVHESCRASIGSVSNPDQKSINLGKAGRSRWLGRRPKVRGVAMNPVDHPHGGGEGKTSGGRHPVTPWGKCTKGRRTRRNKRSNRYILRSRHARR